MACDDVRTRHDPAEEIDEWFWGVITAAQAGPRHFETLTDAQLIAFADEMHGTKTYFSHDPFHPPADVYVSEDMLDEAGAWVISQGRGYFFRVWNEAALFWRAITDHEYKSGANFELAADQVWEGRHGTDIPTI